MALAWYRLRATFGRDRGGLLTVVVLIALIGGLAMAATAAGRRTQSAYPRFLASTNPSDLNISEFGSSSTPVSQGVVAPSFKSDLAAVKNVTHVASLVTANILVLNPDGSPILPGANVAIAGSTDGLLSRQDKLRVIRGRMWSSSTVGEFVASSEAAKQMNLRVGQSVTFGIFTDEQTTLPGFGTAKVQPTVRFHDTLVGIIVVNNQVVQDDIDRLPAFAVLSPPAARLVAPLAGATIFGVQLAHGGKDVTGVEQSAVGMFTPGSSYEFHVISRAEQQVERSVRPESIALGAFGLIALVAALVIGSQAAARQLRAGEEERQVLRAIGASPGSTIGDGLAAVVGAIVIGSVLAVAVAVALSPLGPVGPVRPVYPFRGVAFDWTVLGLGFAILVVAISAVALGAAYLRAPYRLARIAPHSPTSSRLVAAAAAAGMAPSAVVGVRFALEPGRGRTAVPVRSALIGTALAVGMVVATVTFGSSLHTLVSRPALYGWNWDYALNPSNNIPPQAMTLLSKDPNVAAFTGEEEVIFQLDGQNVPALLADGVHPALSPPTLSGHAVDGPHQIVLGAATLAALHKHVGDTVTLVYGAPKDAPIYIPPTPVKIVGTATMPAAGFTSFIADHTSMGTGAVVTGDIVPPAFQAATNNPDPNLNGPQIEFVRLRKGVSEASGRADLQRLADAVNANMAKDPNALSNSLAVIGVQRPAEIVNYRSIGNTPLLLAGGLAVGAAVALGLTLATSVRRRRRDLALMKTLGFTRRQLAAALAWQATVAAAVGVVIGVPLGIALGRQLWVLFARSIDAVPEPSVPVLSVVAIAVGTLVFANLVAALPGRSAAHTPAALVLRAE